MKSITNAKRAYELIAPLIQDEKTEHLVCVTRNNEGNCIAIHFISSGDSTQTGFDPKTIYQLALMDQASGVILAHNHPSGDAKPSVADIKATEKVSQALRVMGIPLIDHLVVTPKSYYSFANNK